MNVVRGKGSPFQAEKSFYRLFVAEYSPSGNGRERLFGLSPMAHMRPLAGPGRSVGNPFKDLALRRDGQMVELVLRHVEIGNVFLAMLEKKG